MEASVMAGSLLTHMPTHRSTLPELLPLTNHCQRPNNRLSSLFVRNPTPSIGVGLRGRMSSAVFCSTEGTLKVEEQVPIEKRIASFPSVMDINKIRETLPHRFPFLLVDRVIEHQFGISAVGIKNVTINDNFFPGHFPEWPIMPGVLIVEAMAQVGGIMLLQPEAGFSRTNFVFAGIDKVRFRKPVTPGDTLVMRVKLLKFNKAYGLAKMEGKAFVGGEVVCEGELLLASFAENK